MRKVILILLLFVFVIGNTCAANDRYWWISSDDKYGFFFDTETIKFEKTLNYSTFDYSVNQNQVNVWIKTIYSSGGVSEMIQDRNKLNLTTDNWENLSHSNANFVFDFKDRKMKYISDVCYDNNGNVLSQYYSSNPAWKDIIPESNAEYWSKTIYTYSKGVGYNAIYRRTLD